MNYRDVYPEQETRNKSRTTVPNVIFQASNLRNIIGILGIPRISFVAKSSWPQKCSKCRIRVTFRIPVVVCRIFNRAILAIRFFPISPESPDASGIRFYSKFLQSPRCFPVPPRESISTVGSTEFPVVPPESPVSIFSSE